MQKFLKEKAPWGTEQIRKLTKEKNRLRNKYWETRMVPCWNDNKREESFEWSNLNNAKNTCYSDKLSWSDNAKELIGVSNLNFNRVF